TKKKGSSIFCGGGGLGKPILKNAIFYFFFGNLKKKFNTTLPSLFPPRLKDLPQYCCLLQQPIQRPPLAGFFTQRSKPGATPQVSFPGFSGEDPALGVQFCMLRYRPL